METHRVDSLSLSTSAPGGRGALSRRRLLAADNAALDALLAEIKAADARLLAELEAPA